MSDEDEIEVIDLEEYACAGKPIPKRVKYYLIKVDKNKIRVQSPITAEEILIAADLDTSEYQLKQKFKDGKTITLDINQLIDLREAGVERFKSIPTQKITIIVNGRKKTITSNKLSFNDIVSLAFEHPPIGENVCLTITYRNGPCNTSQGTMVEGDIIKIQDRMVFNVTATDKS